PDLYTLSLHDALPIFKASEARQRNFTAELENLDSEIKALKRKLVVAASNLTRLDDQLITVEQRLDEIQQVESQTLSDLESRTGEDRKSTRLNSSHVKI